MQKVTARAGTRRSPLASHASGRWSERAVSRGEDPPVRLPLLRRQVEVVVGGVAGDGRAGGRDDGRAPWGVAGWRLREPVDAADEVALEGSEGFAAGLAFGLFAIEERLGRGVVASFVEHEAIERAVELAVAAGVQAVAVGASGGCGDRGGSGQPRELGVAGEASDAGDLADQLGRGQRPAAGVGRQPWSEGGNERGELLLECRDRARELADALELVATTLTRVDCSVRCFRSSGDTAKPLRLATSPRGQARRRSSGSARSACSRSSPCATTWPGPLARTEPRSTSRGGPWSRSTTGRSCSGRDSASASTASCSAG